MKRIQAIDAIRGLVMVIMVLDHSRDFLHITSLTNDPTDLKTTTVALFFTRWITHLCAPTFVFLAGVSAFISSTKALNRKEFSNFLIKRGLWLILLEFTVINFGLWFDVHFRTFLFQVIAAIGVGFIVIGLCCKMSYITLGFIGITIIFTHQLLNFIPVSNYPVIKLVLTPFFAPGIIPISPNINLYIGYPPIPWLGIILLGYGMGHFFLRNDNSLRMIKLGILSISLFILIRIINIYGDPSMWTTQKNIFFTFLSFINVSKYPPSLLFVLLMLGIAFLLIGISYKLNNRVTRIFQIYGKVPFFFYLIHWYILHSIVLFIIYLHGFKSSEFNFTAFRFGRPETFIGMELWAVYLIWIALLIILFPLCKIYGQFKSGSPDKKWLRYI